MAGLLRQKIAVDTVEVTKAEFNKSRKYGRTCKLGNEFLYQETAIKQQSGTHYKFQIKDFIYNELHPALYLKSKIRIKGALPAGMAETTIFDEFTWANVAACLSNDLGPDGTTGTTRDYSRVGMKPCPVARCLLSGHAKFGESSVNLLPREIVEDLAALYPLEAWNTDMALSGPGPLNYGSMLNTVEYDAAARHATVTVYEPLILLPQCFGGESANGLLPTQSIPGLLDFTLDLTLDGTYSANGISVKNILRPVYNEFNFLAIEDVTIVDVDLEYKKVRPHQSFWNLKPETRRMAPFVYTETLTSTDGNFKKNLDTSTIQFEKIFLRAYTDNGLPVPIESLKLSVPHETIEFSKHMTREQMQALTQKNGYRKFVTNNSAINRIGQYGVCLDFNDLSLNESTIISANTIVNQNWSLECFAIGDIRRDDKTIADGKINKIESTRATKLVVNRLYYGVCDISKGSYSQEEALWTATDIKMIGKTVADKADPKEISQEKKNAFIQNYPMGGQLINANAVHGIATNK